ncbi:hypothetical protein TNCT_559421 [Trichonephila clavata]|uniref:Uncharacterized protein n=1 Tax=Trichonephila clavata TaxID=2740835 RepID=A0A8X6GA42_TRICU|nr:hypothetical protein TNCT_559421 [Trichonephila clavata]
MIGQKNLLKLKASDPEGSEADKKSWLKSTIVLSKKVFVSLVQEDPKAEFRRQGVWMRCPHRSIKADPWRQQLASRKETKSPHQSRIGPGGLVLTFTCQVLDVDISRPPDHIGTDELPHQGGVIPGDPKRRRTESFADPGTKRANDDRVEKGRPASGTQRLQNGLVFGDLISSGGHQRVVTVLKGHREIDNHGLATLLSQAAGLPWSPYSTLMWRLRLLSRGKLLPPRVGFYATMRTPHPYTLSPKLRFWVLLDQTHENLFYLGLWLILTMIFYLLLILLDRRLQF